MENSNKENINNGLHIDEELEEALYDDEKLEKFVEEKILKESSLFKTFSNKEKKEAITKEVNRFKELRKSQKKLNI